MTIRTKIDVHARTLSMEFGDNMVQFNLFEAMKHLIENHFVFGLDMIDVLVDDYMGFVCAKIHVAIDVGLELVEVAEVVASQPPSPSIMQPLALELKPLLEYLKYAYLEDDQKISKERLLQVLRKHREAICWTLANFLGINPSICMHRILLEEEAQLVK
ncbi:hypothetical protein CR513_27003, partial [Mucuna pruriens]